ncbi:hypothetical protein [Bosea sp. BK604]|uniref:hypothetical protein n=1 Tax=Bosea sp. BK604 TaxID=2512180 RepID=UPI00104C5670|nr:hypothetical protein [Bosea sp. BK604]TCR65436.1 hypothetical protein EV560_105199 [Bosea sp. BK604]
MTSPWDRFPVVKQPAAKPETDQWSVYAPVQPEKPPAKRWQGSVLPLSKRADGKLQFDSDAGILGDFIRTFTAPGDVYSGKLDPLSEEGRKRAMEMAATFSPMNPAIRAGDHAIPGVINGLREAKVVPPTAEALKQAASKGFDALRDMGVQYSPDAVTRHVGGLRAALEQDGILDVLAPKTFEILSKFDNPPANSVVTSAGLEAARRAAQKVAKDFTNETEQEAAQRLVDGLAEFVGRADPRSVVAGPAAAAAETLTAARGNRAAAERSEKFQGVEEGARLKAARTNSGFDADTAVRERADSILSNPREVAGFSKDEREALKAIIKGGTVRNTLRSAGNLMGGRGGLGAAVSGAIGGAAGGAVGGPVGIASGAAAPLAGMAARGAANRISLAELGSLDAATRARSPLYLDMLGRPAMELRPNFPIALNVGRAGSLAALGQGPALPAPDSQERWRLWLEQGGA